MKRSVQKRRQLHPATVLLIRQLVIGFLCVAGVSFAIAVIWFGTRMDALSITTITIDGEVTVQESLLHEVITRELEGAYFGIIPHRFSYVYPEVRIEEALMDVDRVKEVTLERRSRRELRVEIIEYIPEALWCSVLYPGTCFFVDHDGYAFAEAPELHGERFVRYLTLMREPEKRQALTTVEDFKATRQFVDELATTHWYVTQVEIDSARDVFYTLHLGSELKTTLTMPVMETLRYLNVIRASEEYADVVPGNFAYLDLRFGSKVFFKRLPDPTIEEAVATATELRLE